MVLFSPLSIFSYRVSLATLAQLIMKSHHVQFLYQSPFLSTFIQHPAYHTLSLKSSSSPCTRLSRVSSFCHSLLSPPKLFFHFARVFSSDGTSGEIVIHTTIQLILSFLNTFVSYCLRTQCYAVSVSILPFR